MFEAEVLDASVGVAPGPSAVAWLASVDPASCDFDTVLTGLDSVRRLVAWTAGVQTRLLAAAQHHAHAAAAVDRLDRDWLSEEVGAVLRVHGGVAKTRMLLAEHLSTQLPTALAHLETGDLSPLQARLLAEATLGLPVEVCTVIPKRVLPQAGSQTTTQFTRSLTRAVMAAYPQAADTAHAEAVAQRRVIIRAIENGMAVLIAYLPCAEAMRLKTAIWRLGRTRTNTARAVTEHRTAEYRATTSRRDEHHPAEPDSGTAEYPLAEHDSDTAETHVAGPDSDTTECEPATGGAVESTPAAGGVEVHPDAGVHPGVDPGPYPGLSVDCANPACPEPGCLDPMLLADQCRADALIELADRYLTESDPTGALNRHAPAVHVTLSLNTLTGDSHEPGELTGYGPIPASLARLIASDDSGTWQRLITDPLSGQLLNYGRTRYEPPTNLDQHIKARDKICLFPTCNHTASSCETDHTLAWDDGGHTKDTNLAAVCPRHHHLKHNAGWSYTRDPITNTTQWTSPTHRTYNNPRPG